MKRPLIVWLLLTLLLGGAAWADTSLPGDLEYTNLGALKIRLKQYVDGGSYHKQMREVADDARRYLEANLKAPSEHARPALVLDIDETSLSNWEIISKLDFGYQPAAWAEWIQQAKASALPGTLELYRWAREHQVAVIFITGRSESERAPTEVNLKRAGYDGWERLICHPNGPRGSAATYKSHARRQLTEEGFRIIVNLGDQDSDLAGGYADGEFKLPNPMYLVP